MRRAMREDGFPARAGLDRAPYSSLPGGTLLRIDAKIGDVVEVRGALAAIETGG